MADRFYKDIELPDVAINLPAPDAGFIQVYGKNGKLAYQNSTGAETVVEPQVVTKLIIDGGSPSTAPENYVLRFDFGGVA